MLFLGPRAYVFISLNAARLLSVIVMLLVFASNVVIMANDIKAFKRGSNARMIVNDPTLDDDEFECDYFEGSTVPNQAGGIFFAILNRFFILFVAVLLILSEISWPSKFFINFVPVLGPDFGVGILGAIQCVISASILSHYIDLFPRVSAWFLFSVGCLNILLGLIFRSSIKEKRSLLKHKESRARDLLPGGSPHFKVLETAKGSIFSGNDEKSGYPFGGYNDVNTHPTGGSGGSGSFGFGRQGSKAAELKGFLISRPVESLPRYHPSIPDHTRSNSSASNYERSNPHHVVGDHYDGESSSSRSASPTHGRSASPAPGGHKVTFESSTSRI